jgi:hypothetical protein
VDVRATPATLDHVLAALDRDYPGMRFRMVDESGRLRPHVQIFVNALIERDLASPLPRGAEVMIVGALSGG